MLARLEPDDYLDAPYGRGGHVVMLYMADDLAAPANEVFEVVHERMMDPSVSFWSCCLSTENDALATQACRLPQYRAISNGSERGSLLGLQEPDDLLQWVYQVLA